MLTVEQIWDQVYKITEQMTLWDALDIMAGGYRLEISDGKIQIIKEGEEC